MQKKIAQAHYQHIIGGLTSHYYFKHKTLSVTIHNLIYSMNSMIADMSNE